MSKSFKSFKDLVDEFVTANPGVSRSKARRLMEAQCHRNAVRLQEFKGDARYAPLTREVDR